MKQNLKLFVGLLVMASLVHCGKDEDDSDSSSTPDDVVAGDQPDPEAGRHSTPPDTTPPDAPSSFAAAMGDKLGEVKLIFAYPEYVQDYSKIEVRRAVGKTAPADCTSGDLALTVTDFSKTTFADIGLYPGSDYSYRACIYDESDNMIDAESASVGRASDYQRGFATSVKFDGNLKANYGGKSFSSAKAGADGRCQQLADAAEIGGKWEALLSYVGKDARVVSNIYRLHNMDGELAAANAADLYDGTIGAAIKFDEKGNPVEDASDYAWTGSGVYGDSAYGYSCNGWTSNSASVYGYAGDASAGPNASSSYAWIISVSTNCASELRLYCAESVGMTIDLPSLSVEDGDGSNEADVSVDFTGNYGHFTKMELVRSAGKNFNNHNCATSSNRFRSRVVKTYTGVGSQKYVDETLTDTINFDALDNEEGHYNYFICAMDSYQNYVGVGSAVSVETDSTYLKSFVGDTAFDGSALSQAAANTDCDTSAGAGAGTYKALVSEGNSALTNVGETSDNLVFDMDGNYVGKIDADNWDDFAGSIQTEFDGTKVAEGTFLWTGVNSDGSESSNDCTNWTANGSGVNGRVGMSSSVVSNWSSVDTKSCDNSYRVACIQAN